MTYNDILFVQKFLLENIPLDNENYRFPANLSTKIILMQVEYEKKVRQYEELMSEVLTKLKPKDYDDTARAIQQMEDVFKHLKAHEEWDGKGERPAKPSDEDIAQANKTREIKDDFDKQTKELIEKYNDARQQKAAESVDFDSKLSHDDYERLVGIIGLTGEMPIKGINDVIQDISKMQFLRSIALNLVQE